MRRTSPPTGEPMNGGPRPQAKQGFWFRLAWFAGVDLQILAKVPSEVAFYSALGATVVLVSCLSGLTAALAVGYALQELAAQFWWIGIAWAGVLAFGIERLILQLPMTGAWWTLALSLAWRVALSILIALLLSEPLILRINEDEVNAQLTTENRIAIRDAKEEVQGYYDKRIADTRAELRDARDRRIELRQKQTEAERRSLEAGEAGCGAACLAFATTAHELQIRREAVERRNEHRQPELHKKLDELHDDRAKAETQGEQAVERGNGLWARVGALQGVIRANPGMEAEVWVLRFFFLLLDLLPLVAKCFHTLRRGSSPYEERLASSLRQDSLPAKAEEAEADVIERRFEEQARADMEVDRARIMLDADWRIAEAGGPDYASGGIAVDTAPVSAWRLRDYAEAVQSHENQPVDVRPELRRGGLIGVGLIAALAVLGTIWSAIAGQTMAGMWLVVGALCATVALALATHGFRRAPAWGLWSIHATFFVGLALPFVVTVLNM
jgi:Domain of unknown function (DUF4407)